MAVSRNRGLSRCPPPLLQTFVAALGPLLHTLVAGLFRVLWSSTGLSQGEFVARPPDSVASLVVKRPPGPVTRPMFLRRCHINSDSTSESNASIHTHICRERGKEREQERERVINRNVKRPGQTKK